MGRLRHRRYRSNSYLASVRSKPCLHCGAPGEAHHLTFAEPRAMGLKTGDHYVVPLCHRCHMELHDSPMPEKTWWAIKGINPVVWAENNFARWSKENGDDIQTERDAAD